MTHWNNFSRGLFKENAVFVLFLGLCPTLAVTTSAFNGLGMGLATSFVLLFSNMVVSMVKVKIPDKVRIPCYIVIIATFVTIVNLLMEAYTPDLHEQLGLFIPLIVVNCVVLGRTEAFASKNSLIPSALDGLGTGLGFTMSLTLLGAIRECLGAGSVFGFEFIKTGGLILFILPPGAFLVLGYLIVFVNKFNKKGT